DNNLSYCEIIENIKPRGEHPMHDHSSCCLCSLKLITYVIDPITNSARFVFDTKKKVARLDVRILDKVLIVTKWPLEEQQLEADAKRRLGLGFTGLGDALIMLGIRYGSEQGRALAAELAEQLRDAAYQTSIELAQERGAFPLFDAEKYLQAGFASRLP